MSEIVIFDTSVLVDDLRTGRHEARIQSSTGLIRNSAVVLAELWRGASKSADRDFVHALSRNHPILTPTEKMWTESGQLLARIRSERGLAPDKLRDLHFDLLIALTARAHGARLITSNRDDFQLVYQYRKFKLEIW
ncbi:MAG TPA: type II toxin-antitoxin system VapC family toxin [Candidatus Sulfotelmatobacter sp.]|nr:type II toxin-antitoxin system VapC family toxin [Candidatus Sulfotelmatobacter sp.]